MRFLVVSHDACLEHDSGWGHPERPERIGAVLRGAVDSGQEIVSMDAPRAGRAALLLIHKAGYVDEIEQVCRDGGAALDPDTRVGKASWEAALRSAGGGPGAITALREGTADAAFVATRPPGHHALAARAMGFCVFNNIGVAAATLTAAGDRVAIVDWDVHHGNGTQEAFFSDGRVLYVSLHESRFYPGTGSAAERGVGPGAGTTVNLPMPAGTDGAVYRWLMHWVVAPQVARFAPDWLLVSAGYDAHRDDPLADMELVADDYAVMAGSLAHLVAPGRTIFFLEGGYDLDALRTSTASTLLGHAGISPDPPAEQPSGSSLPWQTAVRLAESLASEEGQGA